jgi:DNA replication protein DnaC
MCVSIGIAACELGMPVRHFTTTELVMLLIRTKEDGSLAKLLRQLARADLLFLDEFGYVPADHDGERLLFQVISEAHERQSLIIATNLDFSRRAPCPPTTRWPWRSSTASPTTATSSSSRTSPTGCATCS